MQSGRQYTQRKRAVVSLNSFRDFGRKDSMGSQIVGKQSIAFQSAVYIAGSASVVGPKEAAGPLGEWFDVK